MTSGSQGSADVDRLLAALSEVFEGRLRSCVEYTPRSKTIHYLRDDIERNVAKSRLVRIEQLYQAERLDPDDIADDPELGRLHLSTYFFGGAVVVHLIDDSGRVVGFSLDAEATPDLAAFAARWLETGYGTVPAPLDLS